VQHYHADAAIVTEPTDLSWPWRTAASQLEVETIGRQPHGSRYQDGIDAIC